MAKKLRADGEDLRSSMTMFTAVEARREDRTVQEQLLAASHDGDVFALRQALARGAQSDTAKDSGNIWPRSH